MSPLDDDSPEARAIRRHHRSASLRGFIEAAAWFLLFCATIALICGWLGRFHWFLELFSHFVPQIAAVLALSVLLAAVARYWVVLVPGLLLLGASGWMLYPYYSAAPRIAASKPGLRVLLFNVLSANEAYADFLAHVEERNPDVIALLEINQGWVTGLATLEEEYPHHQLVPRVDNFGVALYSRLPFTSVDVTSYADVDLPNIVATVEVGGKPITLVVTHPPPPLGSHLATLNRRQMAGLSGDYGGRASHVVLLGDLNAAPWSPTLRTFLTRTGFVSGRLGQGLQPTWPADIWPLLIPIDHVLVGPGLGVRQHEVGPHLGSDHLPLFVDVAVLD